MQISSPLPSRHAPWGCLALLAHSHLPNIFWEDAFLTAVYIINRLPTPILQHKSPYEMVNNSKPDFNFL